MDEVPFAMVPTDETTTAKVQVRAKEEEERVNEATQQVEAGADRVIQRIHP